MSPFDMLLFFFFILVTIKAAASCIDYWKDKEADVAVAAREYRAEVRRAAAYKTAASGVPVSRMNVRPSAARITPIKRVNAPAANIRSYRADTQCQLNDKGAA